MERTRNNSPISVVVATLNDEERIGPTLEELHGILNDPHSRVLDGNSVDRVFFFGKNMGAGVLLHDGKDDGLFPSIEQLSSDAHFWSIGIGNP